MKLFITDNLLLYTKNSGPHKILVSNSLLVNCSWLREEEIGEFNKTLNTIEIDARNLMLKDLYSTLEKLSGKHFSVNPYLGTRKVEDQTHFLLYLNFNHFLPGSYALLELYQRVINGSDKTFTALELHLDENFTYCAELFKKNQAIENIDLKFYSNFNPLKNKLKRFLKSQYYLLSNIFQSPIIKTKKTGTNQKHLLFALYNVAHHHDLLKTVLQLTSNRPDLHISIVHISWGGDADHAAYIQKSEATNIDVYNITQFRDYKKYRHDDFYAALKKINTYFGVFEKYDLISETDISYTWMANAFKQLKPDACLHIGIFNVGRVMSDVARYHKVPSINLEYGLAFDDPAMESNIEFTLRACIGADAVELWKKHKDPSVNHEAIGFCKLDEVVQLLPSFNKELFYKKNNLDINRKTIFFASTWAPDINKIYDFEKETIINQLSDVCHKNNWNFIVKKHPLEFDTIAHDALVKKNYEHQRCFEHIEANLLELVYYCDLVTNQLSSIVIEALYFNKPFCYLTSRDGTSQADYMTFIKDGSVPKFNTMAQFEAFAQLVLSEENKQEYLIKINNLKEKYIFKSDAKASERLLEAILDLSNHSGKYNYNF